MLETVAGNRLWSIYLTASLLGRAKDLGVSRYSVGSFVFKLVALQA
jgi:hypothetical protein